MHGKAPTSLAILGTTRTPLRVMAIITKIMRMGRKQSSRKNNNNNKNKKQINKQTNKQTQIEKI